MGRNDNYAASPAVAIATFKVADSDAGDANKNPAPTGLAYTGAKVDATVNPAALTNSDAGGSAEYESLSTDICTVVASGALTGIEAGDVRFRPVLWGATANCPPIG